MKELGFTVDRFKTGLNTDANVPINDGSATECLNMTVGKSGLSGTVKKSNLPGITATYPFPQLVSTYFGGLLLTKDAVYYLFDDGSTSLALDMSSNFAADSSLVYRTWDIADAFPYFLGTNGTIMFQMDTSTFVVSVVTISTAMPILTHVRNHNGQLVGLRAFPPPPL